MVKFYQDQVGYEQQKMLDTQFKQEPQKRGLNKSNNTTFSSTENKTYQEQIQDVSEIPRHEVYLYKHVKKIHQPDKDFLLQKTETVENKILLVVDSTRISRTPTKYNEKRCKQMATD